MAETRTSQAFDSGRFHALAGFSLLELLAVLALAALLAGLAAAQLGPGKDAARHRASVHDLVTALRQARALAILRGRSEALALNVDTREFSGNQGTINGAFSSDTSLLFLTSQSERVDAKTATIRFFPDGSATGGEIIVSRRGRTETIRVNWLTGHVSHHSPVPAPERDRRPWPAP